jgi:O-methyltransferase
MHDIKTEFLEVSVEGGTKNAETINSIKNEIVELNSIRSRSYVFEGLGLATAHALPWEIDPNIAQHLSAIHNEIKDHFEFSLGDNILNESLGTFMWRSAMIYYLVNLTINKIKPKHFKYVECGVGDGITAYVVMSLLDKKSGVFHRWSSYLCDLWKDSKTPKFGLEKNLEGVFDQLSFNRTEKNLSKFSSDQYFIHGELPTSLEKYGTELYDLSFIHIDLNFSEPTIRCVEHLYPRLQKGGVILFDDYGWSPHPQTRDLLRKFIQKNGTFMMFPTGQAALFKY